MHIVKALALGVACLMTGAVAAAEIVRAEYRITGRIWIARPPQAVWAVLTDTAAYPAWNPFIQHLSGVLRTGGRIKVDIGAPGDTMSFEPVLVDVEPNEVLRWRGGVWPGGLFDGEHSFTLEPEQSGTEFTQSERFSGLLVGWFTKNIVAETEESFRAMNEALKRRTERPP